MNIFYSEIYFLTKDFCKVKLMYLKFVSNSTLYLGFYNTKSQTILVYAWPGYDLCKVDCIHLSYSYDEPS